MTVPYSGGPHSGKSPEFYPNKQGRPAVIPQPDMSSGRTAIPPNSISGLSVTNIYGNTEITANYNAGAYAVILVDASAGPVVVSLPTAASNRGRYYFIKKVDSSIHTVTVQTYDLIDGQSTIVLQLQYQYIQVVCDSTTWHVIGGVFVKVEEVLQDGFSELAQLLRQVIIQTGQSTLHLASLSDEPVDAEDVDEC